MKLLLFWAMTKRDPSMTSTEQEASNSSRADFQGSISRILWENPEDLTLTASLRIFLEEAREPEEGKEARI